jgi:hypothetical protein
MLFDLAKPSKLAILRKINVVGLNAALLSCAPAHPQRCALTGEVRTPNSGLPLEFDRAFAARIRHWRGRTYGRRGRRNARLSRVGLVVALVADSAVRSPSDPHQGPRKVVNAKIVSTRGAELIELRARTNHTHNKSVDDMAAFERGKVELKYRPLFA